MKFSSGYKLVTDRWGGGVFCLLAVRNFIGRYKLMLLVSKLVGVTGVSRFLLAAFLSDMLNKLYCLINAVRSCGLNDLCGEKDSPLFNTLTWLWVSCRLLKLCTVTVRCVGVLHVR